MKKNKENLEDRVSENKRSRRGLSNSIMAVLLLSASVFSPMKGIAARNNAVESERARIERLMPYYSQENAIYPKVANATEVGYPERYDKEEAIIVLPYGHINAEDFDKKVFIEETDSLLHALTGIHTVYNLVVRDGSGKSQGERNGKIDIGENADVYKFTEKECLVTYLLNENPDCKVVKAGEVTIDKALVAYIYPVVVLGPDRIRGTPLVHKNMFKADYSPKIEPIEDLTCKVGESCETSVIAADPGDTKLVYSLNSDLDGIITDEGDISFTLEEKDVGTHRAAVSLTNEYGLTANTSFDVVVEAKKETQPPSEISDVVEHFSDRVEYLFEWGEKGKGKGEFKCPIDIEMHNNKVYVLDARNHRIQVFDLDGKFLFEFGRKGKGKGEFYDPSDIEIYNNGVYVLEDWNPRIQVFGLNGDYIGDYTPKVQFNRPNSITIHKDSSRIYIGEWGNDEGGYGDRIIVFGFDGKYKTGFGITGEGTGEFDNLGDIVIHNSRVYVADTLNNRIQIFDLNGNYKKELGKKGKGKGEFKYPGNIEIYPVRIHTGANPAKDSEIHDWIFVADSGNNRIQILDLNGNYKAGVGIKGEGKGEFKNPGEIAIHKNMMYVADSGNNRIQVFQLFPEISDTIEGKKKVVPPVIAQPVEEAPLEGVVEKEKITIKAPPKPLDQASILTYNVFPTRVFAGYTFMNSTGKEGPEEYAEEGQSVKLDSTLQGMYGGFSVFSGRWVWFELSGLYARADDMAITFEENIADVDKTTDLEKIAANLRLAIPLFYDTDEGRAGALTLELGTDYEEMIYNHPNSITDGREAWYLRNTAVLNPYVGFRLIESSPPMRYSLLLGVSQYMLLPKEGEAVQEDVGLKMDFEIGFILGNKFYTDLFFKAVTNPNILCVGLNLQLFLTENMALTGGVDYRKVEMDGDFSNLINNDNIEFREEQTTVRAGLVYHFGRGK